MLYNRAPILLLMLTACSLTAEVVDDNTSPADIQKEKEAVIANLISNADGGDIRSQYQAATHFIYGPQKNYAAAIKYLKLASEAGSADALAELGVCFQSGFGVPVDPAEAVRCWTLAAKGGSARGFEWLGIHSFSGYGPLPRDAEKGGEFLRKAISLGRRDLNPVLNALEEWAKNLKINGEPKRKVE